MFGFRGLTPQRGAVRGAAGGMNFSPQRGAVRGAAGALVGKAIGGR